MVVTAGEPIFGVYPPIGGRKPSFPNPTANLVSAKKAHSSVTVFHQGGSVSFWRSGIPISIFVLLSVKAAFFVFGAGR